MALKRFVLLFNLLLITACSSHTKVHLYSKYLNKQQISSIKNNLDKSIFDVVVNEQNFPTSVNDNAIVYAPSRHSRERLNILMVELTRLGFDLSNASLMSANNHSFTENNVGVFLIPDGVTVNHEILDNRDYQFPIVNEYGATNCEHATTLYLKEPDEFFIEVDIWLEDKQQYQQKSFQGQWQLNNNNQLVLSNNTWNKPLVFDKKIFSESTVDGWRKVLSLSPITAVANEAQKAIYCTYTISLAM